MQLLTISDEIAPAIYSLGVQERFPDVTAVCSCGDLPFYYLEFIVTMLRIPCFYVYGNHQNIEYTDAGTCKHAPEGCVSVEGRCIAFHNLLIAGLGGSIRYNREAGAQYTEAQMQCRVWLLAPRLLFNRLRYGRYLDILLTHAPPLGIHNGPDRPHRGFRAFLRFMDYFTPRYLIHGHIHRSYRFDATVTTWYKRTRVVNTVGYRLMTIEEGPPHGR